MDIATMHVTEKLSLLQLELDEPQAEIVGEAIRAISDASRDRDEWKEAAAQANAAIEHYQGERNKSEAYAVALKHGLRDAWVGVGMAYECVQKGRYDEALLHLGSHEARARKILDRDENQMRKASCGKGNHVWERDAEADIYGARCSKCGKRADWMDGEVIPSQVAAIAEEQRAVGDWRESHQKGNEMDSEKTRYKAHVEMERAAKQSDESFSNESHVTGGADEGWMRRSFLKFLEERNPGADHTEALKGFDKLMNAPHATCAAPDRQQRIDALPQKATADNPDGTDYMRNAGPFP